MSNEQRKRLPPVLLAFVHLAYDAVVKNGLHANSHKTLFCVLLGFSEEEIERALHMSSRSAKRRVSRILRCLKIRRRYEVWPAALALLAVPTELDQLVAGVLTDVERTVTLRY